MSQSYFYCKQHLAVIYRSGQACRLFKTGSLPLASFDAGENDQLIAIDAHHSPLRLLSANDMTCIQFDAYGQLKQQQTLSVGFNGEYQDSSTRNYLLGNGYRAYSPTLRRFASPDSLSPFGLGGINSYTYVAGDPVNRQDPTGHVHWPSLSNLIKAWEQVTQAAGHLLPAADAVYSGKGRRIHGIDVFSADDLQTGQETVYIKAHGGPGYVNGKREGYDGNELYVLLQENRVKLSGRETHTLICRSSAPEGDGKPSLNQVLADRTGAPSTGYMARVKVDMAQDRSRYQAQVTQPELYERWVGTHTDQPTTALPGAWSSADTNASHRASTA